MKTKHTPGPWKAQSRSLSDGTLVVKDSKHNEICVIRNKDDRRYGKENDTDIANSILIESAPELLEALRKIIRCNYRVTMELDLDAREAIRKATSE